MRTIALLVLAAALFAAWPLAAQLAVLPGAVALVGLVSLFALAASGGTSSLAAAQGALGAFAAGLVSPRMSAIGGALVLAGAYAERTSRVRGRALAASTEDGPGRAARAVWTARGAHVVLALSCGAVAGALVEAFADASLVVRGVSIGVAAVLAALPRLVAADDLVAHTLEKLAGEIDGPGKSALLAGASLRRSADDALLDRPTRRTVRRTWGALLRLARARVRVQRVPVPRTSQARGAALAALSPTEAVRAVLDGRLADHVAALARAYRAVDAALAAGLSLDDTALRTTERAGDAFEEVSHAMIDLH
jgi:hypothetical protein